MSDPKLPILPIENFHEAKFECVFPVCGGICCQNGRPSVEDEEVRRIEENLDKFVPHLRPVAQKALKKRSFLTNRKKYGCRALAVVDSWCIFFNEGCVLHKVGALEGDKYRYKPWQCVTFPLEPLADGTWHVRQWGRHKEEWDLFCLNPKESPKSAAETMQDELAFATSLVHGEENVRWQKVAPKPAKKKKTRSKSQAKK